MITKKISWGKNKCGGNGSTNSPSTISINSPVSNNKSSVSELKSPVSDIKSPVSYCNYIIQDSIVTSPKNVERKIDISDKFEGIYTNDCDINSIHHSILHIFQKDLDIELPNLVVKLKQLQEDLNNTTRTLFRKCISSEITALCQKIENIKNQKDKTKYLDDIKDLIPRYLEIATEKKVISFKAKKIISDIELKNQMLLQEERLCIIDNYLEIARCYIQINLIRETPKKNECTQCKFDFNLFDEEIDFCPSCGLEHRIILKIPIYSESGGSKATDEKNFMKEFKRFQGLQNIKLPTSLIKDLDKYFLSYGFKSGEEVKLLPLNDDNERFGTSHDMLREALNKTNNSSFYEDINLILNLYWDYPLPDVSHLENGIMDDYKILQKAFMEIDKNRTSSLNAQYRLYKQLQLRGYKCKSSQFKIIKTEIISQKYAELWRQMCELAGFDYIPD